MAVGKVFWRATHKSYYCKIDGKFVRLGSEEDYANQWHRELCIQYGSVKDPKVADLVEIYLKHCVNKPIRPIKPRTLKKKRGILDTFIKMYGEMSPRVMTEHHVIDWLKKVYPNANPTTKKDRIVEVMAVWRHALKRGIISRNPMALLETETPSKRVHYVPYERWPELLAACPNDSLRTVVEFMLFTGVRPQEVVIREPGDWYDTYFMLPIERSKGEKEERYIYVPEFLLASVKRLVAEKRDFVFTNTKGGQWNRYSMGTAFRGLKTAMNDPDLCATSCHHSFATWKLIEGVPISTVAKLMGHTSDRMVYSRYGHVHRTKLMANGANAGL